MTARYRIISYDLITDQPSGPEILVPYDLEGDVVASAGLTSEDDDVDEYPLNEKQIRRIAGLLRFKPDLRTRVYFLEHFDFGDEFVE